MFEICVDNGLSYEFAVDEGYLKRVCEDLLTRFSATLLVEVQYNSDEQPIFKGPVGTLNGQLNTAKFMDQSYVDWKRRHDAERNR